MIGRTLYAAFLSDVENFAEKPSSFFKKSSLPIHPLKAFYSNLGSYRKGIPNI